MSVPRRTLVLGSGALAIGAVTATPAPAAQAHGRRRPDRYLVSTTPGENLEGIEVTRRGTMYVTSVATGAVFRGDVRSPRLRRWLPAGRDGRTSATGVHVDRYGHVLVAGASTGRFYTYAANGRLMSTRQVAGESFLNDFSFTRHHVYVTDSASGTVHRARITRFGAGELEPFVTKADFAPATDFLNGIVTTPDERYLVVSDWGTDVTYRVDLRSRRVDRIEIAGGRALGADGLLLRGHTGYALQTDWETERSWVRVVRFDRSFLTARVVRDSPSVGFDASPTTLAFDRGRLLWVESQLNAPSSRPPFTVARVPGC